jgi:hypothetical protein
MKTMKALFSLLITGMIAACVASPGASGTPSLRSATTLSVARSIPNAGISMEPPTSQGSVIQAKDALSVCKSGAGCPDAPATAELAVATDSGSGSADAAGRVALLMDHRLVWALSWSNVECSHSGPPPAPGASLAPRLTACDVITFVDAKSGTLVYTLSYAHQ